MGYKKRSVALCIVFSIITFGLYFIYFTARVTTETNNLSDKHKTANGFLAFIFGIITAGLYGFYWAYKIGKRVSRIEGDGDNSALYLIICFLGIGFLLIPIFTQDVINEYAESKQN